MNAFENFHKSDEYVLLGSGDSNWEELLTITVDF